MERKYSSCSYCSGSVLERHVTVEAWFGDRLVLFEDVPAGVCENCGEEYFAADIQKQMMTLMQQPPKKTIEVPLYRFADALTVAKSNARRKNEQARDAEDKEDEIHIATDDEVDTLLQANTDDWEG
jgi:YgiT-type zinc finger domain-containing protein